MENLGRGIVAINKGGGQVYISWRLLGSDPEAIAFNLYRSTNGGAEVKLNSSLITATTDYTDTGVDITLSNAYFVKPIINSTEQAASTAFTLPANAPANPFIAIPLQPCAEGAYYVHLAWTGDLNGDGEYDYVVDRLPLGGTIGTAKLDAYKSDGTFMWRIDLGPNSIVSGGHNDGVTVYDLDSDGKAEVVIKTSLGTTFPDNTAVNGEYISVVHGETGLELARTSLTGGGHMGIAYLDGINPSFVYEYKPTSDYFDLHIKAFDYKNGNIIQKPWEWVMPSNHDHHAFHQIRIMDVDLDGKDEICQGGFVIDDNGQSLYANECVHGDRFHISDFDPDRPGLEFFSIQQDNPKLLNVLYFDAATGQPIKRHIGTVLSDVGRGAAGDIDPTSPGMEFWSTQQGVYNSKGEMLYTNKPAGNPNFCIWWDGDLLREHLYETKIDKWNYTTRQSQRILTGYQTGAIDSWRNAPPLYGDLFGDWREEVMFENSAHSQLQIYTTTIPAELRMYTLMHNPGYRNAICAKGYYQTNHPDFFVGAGMDKAPVSPIFTGDMVWKGDAGNNSWDATTQNWQLYGTDQTFADGKKVLFDISGENTVPVDINTTLQPANVIVNAPTNYTFQGTGSLSGTMNLTKAGWGTLTINNNNDFSGATLVDAGTLIINGILSQSNVVVEGKGKIGGSGKISGNLTLEARASIHPGNGDTDADTLHVGGNVALSGKNTIHFDLSDDPTGLTKTNDLIDITGNLTINGSTTIDISPITTIGIGSYTLIKYAGTFTGNLTSLAVTGLDGMKHSLSDNGSSIVLTIEATRTSTSVVWKGTVNGNWDIAETLNFDNGSSSDVFAPGDDVLFDNTATQKTVTLNNPLKPSSVTVDGTSSYIFSGTGSIIGNTGITKNGTGRLYINNQNDYTGPTTINGGTIQIDNLTNGGIPGPLGAADVSSTNLVLNGGTLQYTGATSNTDRGLTLGANNGTIEVFNNTANISILGEITGSGQLIKTGSGMLTLTKSNPYTGGTLLLEGTLNLGSFDAVQSGTGSGTITMEGGTLQLFDTHNGDLDNIWYPVPQNFVVPFDRAARINASGRSYMTGTLTGGGLLIFYTPFVRTELNGDWSAFSGYIDMITDGDGGDFRINNGYGYANASIHLGDRVYAYHKTNGAQTVTIGTLSGTALSNLLSENWVVGGKNTDAVFDGVIAGNSITKNGTGSWTLTNANTYSGTTTVNGGTLVVNNTNTITQSGTGTGTVTVNNTAKLTGKGSLAGFVTISTGGTIAPGDKGLGTLTIIKNQQTEALNNLTLASGSTTEVEIKRNPIANDVLDVSGSITYGGTLSLTNVGTSPLRVGDSFPLFKATGYSGFFTSITPAEPGTDMYWDTSKLTTNGTLSIRGRQIITFSLPETITNGDPDYKLEGTANSGLTVQYTSSNPQVATIVVNQGVSYIHPVAPGTVTITASLPGSGSWDEAEPVDVPVTIEIVTGFESHKSHEVQVSPNPASDKLIVSLPQKGEESTIYVYSIMGTLIQEIHTSEDKVTIPISQLGEGVYTIKVVLPQGTYSTQVVKK